MLGFGLFWYVGYLFVVVVDEIVGIIVMIGDCWRVGFDDWFDFSVGDVFFCFSVFVGCCFWVFFVVCESV